MHETKDVCCEGTNLRERCLTCNKSDRATKGFVHATDMSTQEAAKCKDVMKYMCASLADDVVFPAPLGPNMRNNTGAELDACSIDRLGSAVDEASRGRDACKKNWGEDGSDKNWNTFFA